MTSDYYQNTRDFQTAIWRQGKQFQQRIFLGTFQSGIMKCSVLNIKSHEKKITARPVK